MTSPFRPSRAAILLATFGLLATPPTGSAQERVALRGTEVAVLNLAGEVRVEAGSGGETVIEVTRSGRDSERLRLERTTLRGIPTLRIDYPEDRIVYPRLGGGARHTVTIREDGTIGGSSSAGGVLGAILGAIFDGGEEEGSGDGRRFTIAGSGRGLEAYADLVVRVPRGQTITVRQAVGRVVVANVNGDLRVRTISAPVEASGTRGTFATNVGSGSIRLRDAEGTVTLDTGSGSVTAEGVRGDRLVMDTGSGSVRGSGLTVGRLEVDTGSGRVDLDGVGATQIEVDTGSGSVDVALASPAEQVRLHTGSGGVVLGVPERMDATLTIDTGSGGIDVDVPVRTGRSGRSEFEGVIGEGGGEIRIDTGSGGVRVVRSSPEE